MTDLATIQRRVGVTPDGRWGPNTAAAIWRALESVPVEIPADPLTVRGAAELIAHEAIVLEAYRDSVNIWTWGIGLTAAAGIDPLAFKGKPAGMEQVLKAFVNITRRRYVPAVLRAFGDRALTEAQFTAALSFHYNTGAIEKASWVRHWLEGNIASARASFMEWRRPPEIVERRQKECDLFFDGKWSGDGTALVIPVLKPSYRPAFRLAARVPIMDDLRKAMA